MKSGTACGQGIHSIILVTLPTRAGAKAPSSVLYCRCDCKTCQRPDNPYDPKGSGLLLAHQLAAPASRVRSVMPHHVLVVACKAGAAATTDMVSAWYLPQIQV